MMTNASVQKILGVPGRKWETCTSDVHAALLGDWMNDMSSKVTDLVNAGLNTLVYSGDKDFICNWRGGEKWTNELKWDHSAEYAK